MQKSKSFFYLFNLAARRRRAQVYLIAAPCLVLILFAGPTNADSIDDFVKAEMRRQKIPGLSLAVMRYGRVIKSRGYGLANIELQVPASRDTVYKIGSVSKQFIASAIMLLEADGKLTLDQNVGSFINGTPDTWNEITVRHLLTHTSGLIRESPIFDGQKLQPDSELIKASFSAPLEFKTGEKYQYCNLGYLILAEIISKVSGKPWSDFLSERIFNKIGMSATRLTSETEVIPNRANGYRTENGKIYNAPNYLAIRPSGAFVSSVTDLAKWESALSTKNILSETSLKQMWTPVFLNDGQRHPYGFGWSLAPIGDVQAIHHGGILNGFLSQYSRFPDHGLTIIVLSNFRHGDINLISKGIMGKYVHRR